MQQSNHCRDMNARVSQGKTDPGKSNYRTLPTSRQHSIDHRRRGQPKCQQQQQHQQQFYNEFPTMAAHPPLDGQYCLYPNNTDGPVNNGLDQLNCYHSNQSTPLKSILKKNVNMLGGNQTGSGLVPSTPDTNHLLANSQAASNGQAGELLAYPIETYQHEQTTTVQQHQLEQQEQQQQPPLALVYATDEHGRSVQFYCSPAQPSLMDASGQLVPSSDNMNLSSVGSGHCMPAPLSSSSSCDPSSQDTTNNSSGQQQPHATFQTLQFLAATNEMQTAVAGHQSNSNVCDSNGIPLSYFTLTEVYQPSSHVPSADMFSIMSLDNGGGGGPLSNGPNTFTGNIVHQPSSSTSQ